MGRVLLELEPDGVASLERTLGLEVDDGDDQDELTVRGSHVDMFGRAHELGHLDGALERTLLALIGVLADYEDQDAWMRKTLINIANAGTFSSDRTISQYNDEIWHLN